MTYETIKAREKIIRRYAKLAAEEAFLRGATIFEDVESLMERFTPPRDYEYLYCEEDAPLGEERRFFAGKGLVRTVYESVKEKANRMPQEVTLEQIGNETKGIISLLPRAFTCQTVQPIKQSILYRLFFRSYEEQAGKRFGKTLGKLYSWFVEKIGLDVFMDEEKKSFDYLQEQYQKGFEKYVDHLVEEQKK